MIAKGVTSNGIFIEQCPVALIVLTTKDFFVQDVNTRFLDLIGLEAGIIGMPLAEAIPAFQNTILLNEILTVYTTGTVFEQNNVCLELKTKELCVDLACSPQYLDNHITGVVMAITNCRQPDEISYLLNDKNDKFKELIRQVPVSIAVYRAKELIIDVVNDTWVKLSGKSKEVLGLPLTDAIPEFKNQPFPELLKKVLETGEKIYGYDQQVYLNRNGVREETYFNYVYAPLKDAKGKTTHVISVANEVTQPMMLKKRLEVSEERLNLAIEAAEMGTWDINLANGDMYCSDQTKRHWGLAPEDEFTLDNALAAIANEDVEHVKEAMNKAIENGDKYDAVFRVLGKDNKERWIRGTGKVYLMTDGSLKRFIGTNLDITPAKTEEIRKNDFIGIVSHELKTPISAIKSYNQILKKKLDNLEDDFITSTLSRTDLLVQKMTVLINGFLDVSQLEAGKLVLRMTEFNMAELVSETIIDVKNLSPDHHFYFTPCQNVNVYADKDKIEQVIINLINNAVKYSPKDTEITLRCENVEGYVQLSISDQGPGVPYDEQQHLFKRFYRVQNDKHKTVSGFGIGLYLASEIIQLHQGRIWLTSETGQGAAFYIALPKAGNAPAN